MKKKSASHSAFFNPRVLLGVLIVLAGVSLALFAANPFGRSSTASAARNQQQNQPATPPIDPSALPPGFDCSQVFNLGINRQDNMRAGLIMIECGFMQPASPSQGGRVFGTGGLSQWMQKLLPEPLFIGGADVDVILPDAAFPKVTQSESMEWCGPNNTCVVNYNDSRTSGGCYSGLSYSTDNGTTWHAGQPLCTGHGTNFGDPIVVYNAALNLWFAGDLATGCGGQGVGLWTSVDGITWIPGACAANLGGGAGDRESMWVDNNPTSAHFGRMYISFNNFAVGGGALQVVYSDNGTVWTAPITLNASFIRDVQITGDLQNSGRVYVAAMNEEGGGLTTRQNVMYRSTDGGVTWASTTIGGTFAAVGRQNCTQNTYFVCMFNTPITQWRHMGWGEPVANGNFVSLNYAQHGTGADLGDVYFVRSTDAGVTFGTPVKLNTDTGTAMQWQPSMAGGPNGALFASWYDGREVNGGADLNCTAGLSTQNCYRRWGRISTDNGATWQADDMVGRALSPLPGQPDGTVQSDYQGDYDYHSSDNNTTIGGWTDGRVIISGQSQQDVFVNRVPLVTIPCTPGWSAGGVMPSVSVRNAGVFFPADSNFYAMGGRSADTAGNEFTHIFKYNTATNIWGTQAATYPDAQVNNMACGVLTDAGTPYIYCVGGSQAGNAIISARVFRYNPVTDAITTVAAPWPGAGTTTLPGGFTIFNNKLYILGGFDTVTGGGQSTNQIWEFTPPSTWVLKPTVLTVPLSYIPTTTIGSLIYTGGGSSITAGVVTDTNNSFVYNPVANTIGTITAIPRATGETRALSMNVSGTTSMLVMGGGRTAPNPSNQVNVYNPVLNTWSTVIPPFTNARRNFPTATDGFQHIWLSGGYEPTAPAADTEVFCQTAPSPTPTATATASPSPTSTATATASATFTPTPTPSPTATCSQYTITSGTDTIVPGTTDAGSHCDDCITTVALPFSFQLYGNNYSSVNLSSNGNAQFVTTDSSFVSVCIPWAAHDFAILPLFQDLRTDAALSGCSTYPGGSCGIYYSTSGTAPNRIFNIEWRAVLFGNNNSRENFELRIYENSLATNKRFDVVYGEINGAGATQLWAAGVQGTTASGFYTADFCNVAGNPPGGNRSRTYTQPPCGPTPTATASATASPSPTATRTPTATPTASPSCTPSLFRVLIVYSDNAGPPTDVRTQILAEPGATAVWTDGPPAVAFKANNGHTAAGINAYLGIVAQPITGQWGRTIVNAGRCFLVPCGSPTPTPTASPTPTVTPTGTPSCTPSAWQLRANMPTDLYGAAGASNGTFFYAAGGYSFSSGTTLAVVNRFDPVANTWAPMTNMPQAAAFGCADY